jgi:hypothetical protein
MVAPYLLSTETVIKDPSMPELDSVGTKVILVVLRMLVPDLAGKRMS